VQTMSSKADSVTMKTSSAMKADSKRERERERERERDSATERGKRKRLRQRKLARMLAFTIAWLSS